MDINIKIKEYMSTVALFVFILVLFTIIIGCLLPTFKNNKGITEFTLRVQYVSKFPIVNNQGDELREEVNFAPIKDKNMGQAKKYCEDIAKDQSGQKAKNIKIQESRMIRNKSEGKPKKPDGTVRR